VSLENLKRLRFCVILEDLKGFRLIFGKVTILLTWISFLDNMLCLKRQYDLLISIHISFLDN